MGQRGMLAVKKDNQIFITSLQWSTNTPLTFANGIQDIIAKDNVDFNTALEKITDTIIDYTHISCIEYSDAEYFNSPYNGDIIYITESTSDNDECLAVSHHEESPVNTNPVVYAETHDELMDYVKSPFNRGDGISIIVDYDQDELQAEFWIDPDLGQNWMNNFDMDKEGNIQALTADNYTTYSDNKQYLTWCFIYDHP